MSKPAFFYHASEALHRVGEVWKPRKKEDWMGPEIGSTIENFRPLEYTSRGLAIYMNETMDFSCHVVSKYKYIYLVKPISPPTQHDNTWLGALQGWRKIAKYKDRGKLDNIGLSTIEAIERRYENYPKDEKLLVKRYWSGKNSDNPCWEWITDSLEILKKVS